ncbi:unnamed protein product [Nippostrongylus brasiliensis]|uniref:Chromo domain-containing protein n=1 Tax=Nippostrongylus brasiliensis TaxID=27835 RepID=A0A0N4Y2N0_NIPBR|nr:unnamed protein product [Nippostrongylus brasiliensis]
MVLQFFSGVPPIGLPTLDFSHFLLFVAEMGPRPKEKRIAYLVEKILDTRTVNGKREYLILWQDYGIEEATWESVEHCIQNGKSHRRQGHLKVPFTKHGRTNKYQIESGRKIEAISGVNTDSEELMFLVRYKGAEPQHLRSEFVPSSVLRETAMEEFVDALERMVSLYGPFVSM